MGLNKDRLLFDTADAAGTDNVGAYIRAANGTLISTTNVGGKDGLDVNIINASLVVTATDLDIRNLSAAQDNVAISDGTNSLVVNADGSINVQADISVTSGSDKAEDSAHTSGDIGTYVLAVRQDTLANSVSADGDYASLKVNNVGALYTEVTKQAVASNNSWLTSTKTATTTASLLVTAGLTNRTRVIIQNPGDKAVAIGEANTVTYANGIQIPRSSSIEIDLAAGADIYVISESATSVLRVAEFAS